MKDVHCTACPTVPRHVAAVNSLADAGMYFFDYGNAFLLEARRAGADVSRKGQVRGQVLSPVSSIVSSAVSSIVSSAVSSIVSSAVSSIVSSAVSSAVSSIVSYVVLWLVSGPDTINDTGDATSAYRSPHLPLPDSREGAGDPSPAPSFRKGQVRA